jgi:YtkA-like
VRRLLLIAPILAALWVAPDARAGGWATVGLSSTPSGTHWSVDLTVLQHGRTPLEGVQPKITITNGDVMRTFAARATGRPGVYHAEVQFPSAGRWEYTVDDGFISRVPHTFPPVRIGAAAAPAADGGGPSPLLLVPGIALLLAAVVLLLVRARPHHQPQAA